MNTAENTVREFWRLMATNDFASVKQVLAETFVLEWPQTNELIRGPENFARMNSEYPAQGSWSFNIKRLVASASEVVTHVAVTDGTQAAEAISFFRVEGGRVIRLVEYWPESYAPPSNRAHLTEPLHTVAASAA
ncbi:MAG: nuclear transport factor 2 family protein [Alphaproteobacteria bacterium]